MKLATVSFLVSAGLGLLASPSAAQHEDEQTRHLQKTDKPMSLVALVTPLSGNDEFVFGTSSLRPMGEGTSALLSVDLTVSTSNSSAYAYAYISEGTSCNVTDDDYDVNFLSCGSGPAEIVVDFLVEGTSGISRSADRVDNGCAIQDILGKAVIIYIPGDFHDEGCGIYEENEEGKKLVASMGKYPGYTGDLDPSGRVKVIFNMDNTFTFEYNLKGVDTQCEECGIHIHTGVSCDSHDQVGGHYWNDVVIKDLWTAAGGAVYKSKKRKGKAKGYFTLSNGYGYEENKHRAVVIHDKKTGARVGCGLLE